MPRLPEQCDLMGQHRQGPSTGCRVSSADCAMDHRSGGLVAALGAAVRGGSGAAATPVARAL